MAACHILQEEIYPSQVVNDSLDTSLAPTAATLEEDLNYIRSVLKRIHGGTTWYDIGDQLANLPGDFQVEHYTTSENPVKAGQHKDIHAESVSAPYAVLDNYLQFADDSTPYRFVYETVGPFDEAGGTRIRFSGVDATGGTKSGINFEPNSTEFYSGIRARAYNYEFYTSSFDQFGGFSIISSALLGDVVSISSEFHQTNLRIGLSGGLVSLNARDGNNTVGSLEFSISPPRWSTKTLYLWSQVAPTLISETNALTIGPIGGSIGGLKFGNNEILGVKSLNQHAAIKLNSLGTEPVIVWDTVTAQNENPIVVGQEGYQVWHRGNQGHGSGLDADTVDGVHGEQLKSILETYIDLSAQTAPLSGQIVEVARIDFTHLPDSPARPYNYFMRFELTVEKVIDDEAEFNSNGNNITEDVIYSAFGNSSNTYTVSGYVQISYLKNGGSSSVKAANIVIENDVEYIYNFSKKSGLIKPSDVRAFFDTANHQVILGVFTHFVRMSAKFYIPTGAGTTLSAQPAVTRTDTAGSIRTVTGYSPETMVHGVGKNLILTLNSKLDFSNITAPTRFYGYNSQFVLSGMKRLSQVLLTGSTLTYKELLVPITDYAKGQFVTATLGTASSDAAYKVVGNRAFLENYPYYARIMVNTENDEIRFVGTGVSPDESAASGAEFNSYPIINYMQCSDNNSTITTFISNIASDSKRLGRRFGGLGYDAVNKEYYIYTVRYVPSDPPGNDQMHIFKSDPVYTVHTASTLTMWANTSDVVASIQQDPTAEEFYIGHLDANNSRFILSKIVARAENDISHWQVQFDNLNPTVDVATRAHVVGIGISQVVYFVNYNVINVYVAPSGWTADNSNGTEPVYRFDVPTTLRYGAGLPVYDPVTDSKYFVLYHKYYNEKSINMLFILNIDTLEYWTLPVDSVGIPTYFTGGMLATMFTGEHLTDGLDLFGGSNPLVGTTPIGLVKTLLNTGPIHTNFVREAPTITHTNDDIAASVDIARTIEATTTTGLGYQFGTCTHMKAARRLAKKQHVFETVQ